MTSIRFARPDDVEEIAALWAEAFPGRRTIADRARMLETGGRYGGLETVLVTRDANGRLAGACKIYRMTQHLAGAALPMMGLAAVAVAEWARRQGLGATLCQAAIDEARARGDVLSTLYPFRPDYYERLGWGLTGHLLRHRFHTASLPAYDEARHVRLAILPPDADAIMAVYARVAARSNGPIVRDRRIWAYRLTGQELGVLPVDEEAAHDGAGAHAAAGREHDRVVVYDNGVVTGYAMLRGVRARTPAENALHVRELIAEDEPAYRGLVGYLAAEADSWPRALHFARPEERFEDRLRDPRPPRFTPARSLYFPTATVARGPMLRILDVPAALRARALFPFDRDDARSDARPLRITVHDEQVPANRGPWRVVRGEDGEENVVEPAGAEAASSDPGLETDAATFARIMAGDLAPSGAALLGRAAITGDPVRLDRAFSVREDFFLLDEF